MFALHKTEAATPKALITRPVEQYRRAYGRNDVNEPRQCVFIATTNKEVYPRDETAGRRFWPVKVGAIDTEVLARDRDQLFAEALHAYRRGGQSWPDQDFEKQHVAPQQAARYESDGWEDVIRAYLDGHGEGGECIPARVETKVGEIARHALILDIAKVGTTEVRRISAILEHLGWKRGRRTRSGVPWVRTDGQKSTAG